MGDLELGKRYTWEQVIEAYPGKWARMSECVLGYGQSIVNGILEGIYTDSEMSSVQAEIWQAKSKDLMRRTTSGMAMGILSF